VELPFLPLRRLLQQQSILLYQLAMHLVLRHFCQPELHCLRILLQQKMHLMLRTPHHHLKSLEQPLRHPPQQ
jgi:hypothetical protein